MIEAILHEKEFEYVRTNGEEVFYPPVKTKVIITIESDYPRYVFGRPKYYGAYIEKDGRKRRLGGGDTIEELKEAVKRWYANKKFSKYYERELSEIIAWCDKQP